MLDRPFRAVVDRQLDVFVADERDLLRSWADLEEAYADAGRGEAEESYADVADVLETIAERLYDMRETYAHTLDGEGADRYRSRFDRAVGKRLPGAAGAYRALAAGSELD
jgi:hypothetical protein